jgi:hypothetical protein
MSWRDKNPVKAIIYAANGEKDRIKSGILEATEKDPFFPLKNPTAREYLEHTPMVAALEKVLQHERPEKYLPYIGFFRAHLQDEVLRPRMIDVHAKHPWQFYIHSEQLKDLFPSHYFKDLQKQNVDFLNDPKLAPIFLMYFSHIHLSAVNPDLKDYVLQQVETARPAAIRILDPKDAGFACGGMEKNYRQAVKNDTGLCLINDGLLLAKLYHAKENVSAKKVAFICRDTQITSSNQILWSNYLYAPAEGQHTAVIDAINSGQNELHIDDLKVRPIRPLIGDTSRSIYDSFINRNHPSNDQRPMEQ